MGLNSSVLNVLKKEEGIVAATSKCPFCNSGVAHFSNRSYPCAVCGCGAIFEVIPIGQSNEQTKQKMIGELEKGSLKTGQVGFMEERAFEKGDAAKEGFNFLFAKMIVARGLT